MRKTPPKKSDAMKLLEKLAGGPLTLVRLAIQGTLDAVGLKYTVALGAA